MDTCPSLDEILELAHDNETLMNENADLRRRIQVLQDNADKLEATRSLHFHRQYALLRAKKMTSRDVSNLSTELAAQRMRVYELQRKRRKHEDL